MPQVVDNQVIIARLSQSAANHGICHRFHHIFRNVAFHHVPRQPAHQRHRLVQFVRHRQGDFFLCRFAIGRYHSRVFIITRSGHAALNLLSFGVPCQPLGQSRHRHRSLRVQRTYFLHEAHPRLREHLRGTR